MFKIRIDVGLNNKLINIDHETANPFNFRPCLDINHSLVSCTKNKLVNPAPSVQNTTSFAQASITANTFLNYWGSSTLPFEAKPCVGVNLNNKIVFMQCGLNFTGNFQIYDVVS